MAKSGNMPAMGSGLSSMQAPEDVAAKRGLSVEAITG